MIEQAVDNVFEDVILEYAPRLLGEIGKVYVQENIPKKKLDNAIKNYGNGVSETNVLALYDSTTFGSGKEGFLITKAGFYYKEFMEDAVEINFNEITSVKLDEETTSKGKIKQTLRLHLNGEELVFSVNSTYMDGDEYFSFFKKVIENKDKGLIDETDKIIILEDMPVDVKLNYIKVIIEFVLEENQEFDGNSLSEIQTLMTQLNFDSQLRHDVRSYIANPSREVITLLNDMMVKIPKGSEQATKISLVKDVIRVHRVKNGDVDAMSVQFIENIVERYGMDKDQVEVIEQGIKNDEKIMRGEVKDDQIVKNAKDLAAKAGAVGVPVAAIYMSGSVVGLSAAGLTSGLAALGLGGVLGLSSMVTGIGVVVIAGVGVYKGIQWLTNGSERSKTQKREFFIQEIIKMNQKTINNLAEDVNFFADKIVELAFEAEVNKKQIEKLGRELSVFSGALKTLQQKGINLQEVLQQKE
ncbi:hypothetical protein EJF36_18895 [Bacillus sp. HMF5848]|uniref:hypothetical protein n=1 Tax=Bacillus sp. HMF5848 TaxID=2495421 RepID=UPI000F7B6D9F|nr:hypothetical protein [Bacillus sp. HMF5848]RSK28775.1 hypothetical protein EJF36_18895 [Bacillus sp. HMF5848]